MQPLKIIVKKCWQTSRPKKRYQNLFSILFFFLYCCLIFKLPLLIFSCTNNLISCVFVTIVWTAETEQPYWSLGIEGRDVGIGHALVCLVSHKISDVQHGNSELSLKFINQGLLFIDILVRIPTNRFSVYFYILLCQGAHWFLMALQYCYEFNTPDCKSNTS